MPLDPSTVILAINSKPYFDHELAIAQLLEEGVLFACGDGQHDYISLPVNCNDTFAWGCADAEDLPYSQIEPLYRAVLENPKWGSTKWVCQRRDLQPQKPLVKLMKEDGAWDAGMETLAVNPH